MRAAPWIIAGLMLSAAALAQKPKPMTYEDFKLMSKRERLMDDILDQAFKVKPVRRDSPLRELNITDNEIREVEALVRDVLPRSMVNISPVVHGCSCEEGKGCTDQVYVTATTGTTTRGLQLSKVGEAWTIGAVQRWWLDYDRLQQRVRKNGWAESHADRWEVISRFPVCSDSKLDSQTVLTENRPKT